MVLANPARAVADVASGYPAASPLQLVRRDRHPLTFALLGGLMSMSTTAMQCRGWVSGEPTCQAPLRSSALPTLATKIQRHAPGFGKPPGAVPANCQASTFSSCLAE